MAENPRPTPSKGNELMEARHKLSKALDAWFQSLTDFIPGDAVQEIVSEQQPPEKMILGLPSDFDRNVHRRLGMEALAIMERQMRIGQAHDALRQLRTMLGLKSFLVQTKYGSQYGRGQQASTRSEAQIGKATKQIRKWKEVYRQAWAALERLRGTDAIPANDLAWRQLRPLTDDDCVMLSDWLEHDRYWRSCGESAADKAARQGRGRRALPWLWKAQFDIDIEVADGVEDAVEQWTDEGWSDFFPLTVVAKNFCISLIVIKLEWLHAKASCERWGEEVKLLKAESARVGCSFQYKAMEWNRRLEAGGANGVERGTLSRVHRGHLAHASRQAGIFLHLATQADERHQSVINLKI